jgi:uncharacterized protein
MTFICYAVPALEQMRCLRVINYGSRDSYGIKLRHLYISEKQLPMKDIIHNEDLKRNNLAKSSSPYLLQHVSNPVWWQEWSEDLISYASSSGKPILVSIGYATCHWCHVMASEAFSDLRTAAFLNDHFICIKVDREQRPDIDQYMMDFINAQNGRGGWPLNVFLAPSMNPVYALTYAPAVTGNSYDSFLDIAEKVLSYIEKNKGEIPAFISGEKKPLMADEEKIIDSLSTYYDPVNGGFGNGQKFPSHSTLLYLLYNLAIDNSPSIHTICIKTLDAMRLRGLNDHLQGGIFRYCVDNEWTIPHFEKMLYDQAMALWTYSLAYRVTAKDEYRRMAYDIIRCLDETFESNGFYISAHDADTEHEEGATYLWSYDELAEVLGQSDLKRFSESYYIERTGNMDGRNHLLKFKDIQLDDLEDKLLKVRKNRKQPSVDDKILCGLNALLAISLIQAGRFLNQPEYIERATALVRRIFSLFWDGVTLGHSYRNGIMQRQGFLTDAASLLAAVSMICEDDSGWEKPMKEIAAYVESFRRDELWIESDSSDFPTVPASWFDHPLPSGVSMAEFGLIRVALLTGGETGFREFLQPFQSDFYNITSMICNGMFHVITSPEPLSWKDLPVNSIQVRGDIIQDCFMGTCTQDLRNGTIYRPELSE